MGIHKSTVLGITVALGLTLTQGSIVMNSEFGVFNFRVQQKGGKKELSRNIKIMTPNWRTIGILHEIFAVWIHN